MRAHKLELRSLPRVQARVTKRWISVPVEARVEMQPSSKIFRCMPEVAAILLVAIVVRTRDLLYLIDSRPFRAQHRWRCFIAVTKWTAALVVPYRKWLSTPV